MLMTATARRCSMPSRSSRRRCTSVTAGSAAPGRGPRPTENGGYRDCHPCPAHVQETGLDAM